MGEKDALNTAAPRRNGWRAWRSIARATFNYMAAFGEERLSLIPPTFAPRTTRCGCCRLPRTSACGLATCRSYHHCLLLMQGSAWRQTCNVFWAVARVEAGERRRLPLRLKTDKLFLAR